MAAPTLTHSKSTGSTRYDTLIRSAQTQMHERRAGISFERVCQRLDTEKTGLLLLYNLPRLFAEAELKPQPQVYDEIKARFSAPKGKFVWRSAARWLSTTPGLLVGPSPSALSPESAAAQGPRRLKGLINGFDTNPPVFSASPSATTLVNNVAPRPSTSMQRLPTPKPLAGGSSLPKKPSTPIPIPKPVQRLPSKPVLPPVPPTPPMQPAPSSPSKLGTRHSLGASGAGADAAAGQDMRERFKDKIEARYHNLAGAFRHLDADGSGKLSKEELLKALISWNLGDEGAAGVVEQIFAKADADGSGAIDYGEFVGALAHSHRQKAAVFGKGDNEFGMLGNIVQSAGGRALPGGQVLLNENAEMPKGGAAPRRDYELYELPSGAAPASAAQLEEEKRVLREHIATKYKLFQQAFRHFDADSSGYVDRDELERGIRCFNLPIPAEHVRQIAQQMARADGKIDYASFAAHLADLDRQTHDLWHFEGKAID